MRNKIILSLLAGIISISAIYGYARYVSYSSEKYAFNVLGDVKSANLTDLYDSLGLDIKSKYKSKDEFIESFPVQDSMFEDNKETFLSKVVEKGVASYEYFLPNQDNPETGNRITIKISYSAFKKEIKDIVVQEDNAPIE